MCISLVMDCPSAKRSKTNYRMCGHCHKELSIKIYKEHRRLYYDTANKSWVEDIESIDAHADDCSSSELSSIDDIDVAVSVGQGEHENQNSDDSDAFEEPMSSLENTTEASKLYLYCIDSMANHMQTNLRK